MPTIIVNLLIGILFSTLAYVLKGASVSTPKQKPQDFQFPTVTAGDPIPVVFGTMTIKSPNILWYGEKGMEKKKV
jgi:uncharacterized membrane protein